MRKVVDSNQLRAERLRVYLAASDNNYAVLTDYAAMEAYKGDTLVTIYESMAILSDHSEQVLVLKNTRVGSGLRGRRRGLQNRLIDHEQTRGFSKYVHNLRAAKNGNRALERQLLEHGREANRHLKRLLDDAQRRGATISEFSKMYSKEERKAIRTGQVYSSEMIDKTIKNVLYIAGLLFRDHPNVRTLPSFEELPNTLIFRIALCVYLLVLDWIAHGGAANATAERHRNDLIDMNFAAYGTFFDGLLTADTKVEEIHQEARIWLSALFDCQIAGLPQ